MTRREQSGRGNVVVSTQQRELWRSLNGQAHTYRRCSISGGRGEVLIGCSSWSWLLSFWTGKAAGQGSSLGDKPSLRLIGDTRDLVLGMVQVAWLVATSSCNSSF